MVRSTVLTCVLSLRSQYLERNNITDVTRDHFTFSSKVVIGDYLKVRATISVVVLTRLLLTCHD